MDTTRRETDGYGLLVMVVMAVVVEMAEVVEVVPFWPEKTGGAVCGLARV
jgi:hypothetical protein